MSTSYNYTKVNLFDKPEYYMYADYKGTQFINDYFENRKKTFLNVIRTDGLRKTFKNYLEIINNESFSLKDLDFFKKDILLILKKNESFGNFHTTSQKLIDSLNNNFQKKTKDIFDNFAFILITNDIKSKSEIKFLLDIFVKKFEVYKKIFDQYSKGFVKSSENYKGLSHYLIFSFCLLYYYYCTKNLKYLNTALKINDNICSIKSKINSKDDMKIFSLVIIFELTLVKDLIEKKNIIL